MNGRHSFSLIRPTARHLALFYVLEQGAILSLSPERFILCDNSEIQTRPIKGTLPRLPDPQEDSKQAEKLANSAKDRAENLMIVDLMRNDIGRVAVAGSVKVPELFVVEPFPAGAITPAL
ncbi:chorismate-binding protein [Escherichia coli]